MMHTCRLSLSSHAPVDVDVADLPARGQVRHGGEGELGVVVGGGAAVLDVERHEDAEAEDGAEEEEEGVEALGAEEDEGVEPDGPEDFVLGDGVDVADPGEEEAAVALVDHGGAVRVEVPAGGVDAGPDVEAVDEGEGGDGEEEDGGATDEGDEDGLP